MSFSHLCLLDVGVKNYKPANITPIFSVLCVVQTIATIF